MVDDRVPGEGQPTKRWYVCDECGSRKLEWVAPECADDHELMRAEGS